MNGSTGVAKAPSPGPPRGRSDTDRAWLVWVGFVRAEFRISSKAFWQSASVGAHRRGNAVLGLGDPDLDRCHIDWCPGM